MKRKYDLMYFVGDSWVYAVGQSDDVDQVVTKNNRFSNLVASHYNLPCVNNSLAGAGNEYITRTLYQDLYRFHQENLNPFIVMVYSDPWRREIFCNDRKGNFIISEDTVTFFKDYMVNHYNFRNLRELSAILVLQCRTVCDKFNFDYVDAWAFTNPLDIPYYDNQKTLPERLDLIAGEAGRFYIPSIKNYGHANILGHTKITNAIIKKIDELYS